jgi:hypothetical protein
MGGPGVKMDPRFSLKTYPRLDTVYKGKESLDFTESKTWVWQHRNDRNQNKDKKEGAIEWFAHVILGISIGFVAFVMDTIEENLVKWKGDVVQDIID